LLCGGSCVLVTFIPVGDTYGATRGGVSSLGRFCAISHCETRGDLMSEFLSILALVVVAVIWSRSACG